MITEQAWSALLINSHWQPSSRKRPHERSTFYPDPLAVGHWQLVCANATTVGASAILLGVFAKRERRGIHRVRRGALAARAAKHPRHTMLNPISRHAIKAMYIT
jgi:hypothetical protein